MSNLQFGTLKYILTHEVSLDDLNGYNLTTFGSLAKRGWVARKGQRIVATRLGEEGTVLPTDRPHLGQMRFGRNIQAIKKPRAKTTRVSTRSSG